MSRNPRGPASPSTHRRGALLLNLGTPDGCDTRSVRRYLREFLSDPEVIKLPRFMRWFNKPLAAMIAQFRASNSAHAYQSVWMDEGSPLLVISNEQARELQKALGSAWDVRVAMRYGSPSVHDVLQSMADDGVRDLVAVPMYPQYAGATTGTAIAALYHELERVGRALDVTVRNTWFNDAGYIRSQVQIIRESIESKDLDPSNTMIMYSAHSLPVSYIEAGDPYQEHILETVRLVGEQLDWPVDRTMVTYQSKLGPVEWLAPQTSDVLAKLATQGEKNVLVVPISFTTDCLESLEEIAIRGKETFEVAGGTLHLCPALNSHPEFIDALAHLVRRGVRTVDALPKASEAQSPTIPEATLEELVVVGMAKQPGVLYGSSIERALDSSIPFVDANAFEALKRPHAEVRALVKTLREQTPAEDDFFVWSTCARLEGYGFSEESSRSRLVRDLRTSLFDSGINENDSYVLHGSEAFKHLVRASVGMTSTLPGDGDVSQQLQSARRAAEAFGESSQTLEALMRHVEEAGHHVEQSTSWSRFRVAYPAVVLDGVTRARSFKWHAQRSIAVLGGSTTARSIVDALQKYYDVTPSQLTGIYRTRSRGKQLKKLRKSLQGATRLRVDHYRDPRVLDALAKASVVIFAHDARDPIWSTDDIPESSRSAPRLVLDFNTFASTNELGDLVETDVLDSTALERHVETYAKSISTCADFLRAYRQAESWINDHAHRVWASPQTFAESNWDASTHDGCARPDCACKRPFVNAPSESLS